MPAGCPTISDEASTTTYTTLAHPPGSTPMLNCVPASTHPVVGHGLWWNCLHKAEASFFEVLQGEVFKEILPLFSQTQQHCPLRTCSVPAISLTLSTEIQSSAYPAADFLTLNTAQACVAIDRAQVCEATGHSSGLPSFQHSPG